LPFRGLPGNSAEESWGIGMTDAINQGISFFDSRARVRSSRSYTRLAETVINEGAKPQLLETGSAVRV